jgi:thiamine pyrophosphate-dependent acetolactate synthase large subunit-like protein
MAVSSLRWKVKSSGKTGLTPLETNENRPKEGDPPTAPANKGSDRDRLAQIRMFKYDKKGLGDRTELIRQRLGRLQGEKEDWARKEKKWEEERKEWEKERQLYGEHILDLQKTINDASEYLTSINEDLVVKLGV